jgi:hypothetical protein
MIPRYRLPELLYDCSALERFANPRVSVICNEASVDPPS